MISNFSSLVEFFAAIYVTMAVNNDFCSNFWTPKYYKEMELLLNTYDFSGSSSIHDKLMEEIKSKYEIVQSHAHFRGFILLTLCVSYLIFMGYEDDINSLAVGHYVPLLYSTVLVGMTILFSGLILTKWKRTILMVCLYAVVYFVLKIGNWDFLANLFVSKFLYTYKTQLMIGIILLPIIYQIYVYWLHSSIYKGYLKHHVAFEYERYQKSMAGIKAKDRSKVDNIYMTAWTEAAFASGSDPTLTSFYKVLNQQLLIIASPSYWKLLCSWANFHLKRIWLKVKKEKKKSMSERIDGDNVLIQNMSIQNECNSVPVLDFTQEYADYLVWKKSAGKRNSVTAYCQLKNIPLKDMKAWLRVNNPGK